ncbi:MAG: hypothetical protein COB07_08470 [Sulfurovum sp.]|nr:MAG: hypothetical protein COB07_08470 [Sulfurovum sp.]
MKLRLTIAACVALGFSGCTNTINALTSPEVASAPKAKQHQQPTAAQSESYQQTMRKVAGGIQHDPNYQRIALDTPEKKAWFKSLTYRYWNRQISRQQFISEGLAQYPDRSYEFNFIANGFQHHS